MLRTLLVLASYSLATFQMNAVAEEPLQKILFGSCIKQEKPMPILSQMASERADAMIFLGDNIYADTEDMQVMREKYQLLADNEDFQKLLKSAPTYAVWDDHDFGVNDGGTNYSQKVQSQEEYLNFWNVPKDSPRRTRAGTYDSVILGPQGKRVQLLLIDTRYFRSPLKKGEVRRTGGPYLPDNDATKTMLGDEQWKWLRAELLKPAEIRIVASSIQCLASAAGQETWSNLPVERERLFKLIRDTKANGLFIISGDRHWSEYSMVKDALSYPLYDFTSSSFNQVHPRGTPTENRFRVSGTTYHLQNYGVILIDWSQPEIELKIQIRDLDGESRLEKKLKLSALTQ